MTRKLRRRGQASRRNGDGLLPTIALMVCGAAFIGTAGFAFLRFERVNTQAGPPVQVVRSDAFICAPIAVVDGDTIRCGEERVRLVGIDAPEMPGHCRAGRDCTPGDPIASRATLEVLATNTQISCTRQGTDRYGRTLASCSNPNANLSCEMVVRGAAVIRYGGYPC